MKIKPLHDRVLVKVEDREETTKSGIIIPENASKDESILEGIVIACGEGKIGDDGKTIALTVKTNDKVLMGKWAGNEFKLEGVEHRIVREEDLLGILG